MNGLASQVLDEDAFGEKKGLGESLRTFDAFHWTGRPDLSDWARCLTENIDADGSTFTAKTKTTYTERHERGGLWTVLLLLTCTYLAIGEFVRWYHGQEAHHFSVEKGVGHALQINFDLVIPMKCGDLRVNVQDASGDHIVAGDVLKWEPTKWRTWADTRGMHTLGEAERGYDTVDENEGDHVRDVVGAAKARRKFKKTPRVWGAADSCRVFGSLDLNKVQGDFHITARGHGYAEIGEHLDHGQFNFSHIVNELSFGPFYPSLQNPLDATVAITPAHFFKYQYYVSVVPTIYSTASSLSNPIETNQYAVTSQSYLIGERQVPGIFFKFDIEPILLMVSEERTGFLALCVRLVNVVSGVLVAGGWLYGLSGWAEEVWGRRKRKGGDGGVLHGRAMEKGDD